MRATRDDDEHRRRAGGEDRLDELRLQPGQREVDRVAPLPRRAEAEEPGQVTDSQHRDIGVMSRLDRGIEARTIRLQHRDSLLDDDLAARELLREGGRERRRLDAHAELGVLVEHVVGVAVAAHERAGLVAARPDERDLTGRLVPGSQGQEPVVTQEDDRLLGHFQGDRAVRRGVQVAILPLHRRVEVGIEEPQLDLLAQNPPRGAVDERLVEPPGPYLLDEVLVATGVRQLDVETGGERERPCLRRRRGDLVHHLQEDHRPVVGDDGPIEAPPIPQRRREQVDRRARGHPVDVAVGVHHRAGLADPDRHFEGGQQEVLELAPPHRHRRVIAPRLARRVSGEVFERRDDTGLLEALDVGGTERPDDVRVLAARLLDPPPPVVPHDIEQRRQALVHPDRVHVGADRVGHLLDELGVERRAPSDRRGVHRRAERRKAGEALLVDQGRDPEAGGLDDLGLVIA